MDRNEAEELLSDMLAGEISAHDLDRLLQYEEENPEFREFRVDLETTWGMDEEWVGTASVSTSNSVSVVIDSVLKTISSDKKNNVINLDTLDLLSAAGQGAVIKGIEDSSDHE